MTDQEKNEVLAKWLGWKQKPHIEDRGCGCDYCTTLHWYTPNGANPALPDFLRSVDALAKWCFPKLHIVDLDRMFLSWVNHDKPRPKFATHCAQAILSLIGEDDV